jgi:hypothetical protein
MDHFGALSDIDNPGFERCVDDRLAISQSCHWFGDADAHFHRRDLHVTFGVIPRNEQLHFAKHRGN